MKRFLSTILIAISSFVCMAQTNGNTVPRQKYLVEEFTSHSCVACTYGTNIINEMIKKSDKLAVVCVHGNQSAPDPYNTLECEALNRYLGLPSWPTAAFNRIYFNADDQILPSLGYAPAQASAKAEEFLNAMETHSVPSYASIKIACTFEGSNLIIQVSGNGSESAQKLLEDYSLTVYITEDGLVYRQKDPSNAWITNYTHNHVLRKVASEINGSDINWTSNSTYSNIFTVDYNSEWVKENVSLIAFISKKQPTTGPNRTEMQVSNANSVTLLEALGDIPGPDDPTVDINIKTSKIDRTLLFQGESMSPNAKYVAGMNYVMYHPVIWNTVTGEETSFKSEDGTFHSINDNGLAVGRSHNFAVAFNEDGTQKTLAKISEEDNSSEAWAVSADGNVIVGYVETSDFDIYPCIWDGEGKISYLPLPESKDAGCEVYGGKALYMTPDAKYILGSLITDDDTEPATMWILGTSDTYECRPICKDFYKSSITTSNLYEIFEPCGISINGKWISLLTRKSATSGTIQPYKAARLNMETNQLETLTMQKDKSMQPKGIANDGSMLLTQYLEEGSTETPSGYLWEIESTETTNIDRILKNIKKMPMFASDSPQMFATNGTTIMGYCTTSDNFMYCYVVDLKEYEEATGIEQITIPQNFTTLSNRIYNISGQQVKNMNRSGLYIINGKKYLVK